MMKMKIDIKTSLLNFFVPERCTFCGKVTAQRKLCDECRKKLPYLENAFIPVDYADACLAPLKYEGDVRKALHNFKFENGFESSVIFGDLMYACLKGSWRQGFDVITWVPVNPIRRIKRKYDQAKLLAKRVSKLSGVRIMSTMIKFRNIAPQFKMDNASQRSKNVAGAYRLISAKRVKGKRILLIDDVVTTGSTLTECCRLLLKASAASVVCLCYASAYKD